MVDQVLTKQKLINADEDLGDLEEVLNGPPGKLVKTRLGRQVYTLASVPQINTMTREEVTAAVAPKADKVYVDNIVSAAANGVIPFQTQSELLLAKPTQVKVLAKAMDVRKEYLWNRTSAEGVTPVTGNWVDTGLSELDQAKDFANSNSLFKPVALASPFDFNNLTTEGLYYIFSGATFDASLNKPADISNQWARIEIIRISENVIGQKLWCLNAQKMISRFRNASLTWSQWSTFSSDSSIMSDVVDTVNAELDVADLSLGAKVTSTIVLNYENLSKNIFDKNAPLLNNHRITTNGLIQRHDNSVSTSLIPVTGLTSVTVSGLTASAGAYRATRFLDKNKKKIGVNTPVLLNATSVTANVPANAVYFQITLKDGLDTWDLNLDTIQIESGSTATAYVSYVKGKLLGEGVSEIYVEPTQVLSIVDPVFENLSKNIFDKTSALLLNQRITAQGVLEPHSNSVTTQPIYIKGLTSVTVSGLTASAGAYRATRFLDKDKKKVGVNTPVLLNATSVTANVPANAVYFQITLKDGLDTWDLNLDTIQIESGSTATAYVSYVKGSLKALLGSDLAAGSGGGLVSKAFNRSVLFIGDSITQTSRVDLGVFDSLDNPFPNFPTYLHDILDIAEFNNYGYSGATFAEYGQVDWRKASHQITQAIANGVDPDIIVVAMGTNDYDKTLGDYETAMSKATLDDLDRTKTLEAARWSFWTIRKTFPNAVCFYCNPLQRGALDSTAFAPTVDGLSKMSLRYGFTLIDQHHESGIIRDLEIGGLHTYLADELHPNTAGRILQAQYIASKIIARMMY